MELTISQRNLLSAIRRGANTQDVLTSGMDLNRQRIVNLTLAHLVAIRLLRAPKVRREPFELTRAGKSLID